jgi:hypothetical protein
VLGADCTWSPERVAELLGDDCGDNPSDYSLGRDHGLVEFFWQRSAPGLPWEGSHFSVQAHRLGWGDPEMVNPLLRERYGIVAASVAFADVAVLLEARGVALVEVPYQPDPDEMSMFWQPDSRAIVSVITGDYFASPGHRRIGDVYKIQSPAFLAP